MAKPTGPKVNIASQELIKQRSFIQAVRTGGISSAARLLGLTPSAVSKNIMRLESELGAQLLARDNRNVVVTERGQQAFDAWSALVIKLDQVQQELRAPNGTTGQLGLSIPSGALPWLMPLVSSFRSAYPSVQIRLNVSDATSDLVRDRNDMAVRLGPLQDSNERSISLGSTPLLVCAAPSYLARMAAPTIPDELPDDEGLLFRLTDSGRTRPIMLPTECATWRVVATVDDGQSLVQGALFGLGLIQVPLVLVEADIIAGRLVELLPAYRPAPLDVSLMFQATSWLPAQARAFIDTAKTWRHTSGLHPREPA
jgi:LysR family transcriptional regulator for bpeEF and oprC